MESTTVLIVAVAAVAAVVGFLIGRQRPRRADVERISALEAEVENQRTGAEAREAELESELAAAKQRAEAAQTGIDEHFEASAELLGRLAKDYRSLFEHWADGAHRLGSSATRAEAIIEQARERLLVEAPGPDGADPELALATETPTGTDERPPDDAPTAAADTGVDDDTPAPEDRPAAPAADEAEDPTAPDPEPSDDGPARGEDDRPRS